MACPVVGRAKTAVLTPSTSMLASAIPRLRSQAITRSSISRQSAASALIRTRQRPPRPDTTGRNIASPPAAKSWALDLSGAVIEKTRTTTNLHKACGGVIICEITRSRL